MTAFLTLVSIWIALNAVIALRLTWLSSSNVRPGAAERHELLKSNWNGPLKASSKKI